MNLTNQERNLNKGSSGFLTNSVLIQELEKRLKAGTIKMEVINSVKTDPLTSRLFNLKKSSEEQNSNSSSFFNRNTLL